MENVDILNVQLAVQQDGGHYILNDINCDAEILEGKIFAIRFDKIVNPTYPSFLSSDRIKNYPLYGSDGATFLSLSDLNESVILLTFNNKKWQLVKTIFRSNENVGHVLTDDTGKLLPNRQIVKFENFDVLDSPGEGAIKLSNPIWSMNKIKGLTGAIEGFQWYPLYLDTLEAPKTGDYRIIVNLQLNNISAPMREIGVKVGQQEDWLVQEKRLRHSFVIIDHFEKGESLIPAVYVDKMVTSDTINIEDCNFYIECLRTREV